MPWYNIYDDNEILLLQTLRGSDICLGNYYGLIDELAEWMILVAKPGGTGSILEGVCFYVYESSFYYS
jgi:hypothetical protein